MKFFHEIVAFHEISLIVVIVYQLTKKKLFKSNIFPKCFIYKGDPKQGRAEWLFWKRNGIRNGMKFIPERPERNGMRKLTILPWSPKCLLFQNHHLRNGNRNGMKKMTGIPEKTESERNSARPCTPSPEHKFYNHSSLWIRWTDYDSVKKSRLSIFLSFNYHFRMFIWS